MADVDGLTEKEKQTLRLILRGHDAKSTARELGLSVHTINERLRDARRKLSVSSSREAARLLFEREGHQKLGDKPFGEDEREQTAEDLKVRVDQRRVRLILGAMLMSILFAVTALATLTPGVAPAPPARQEAQRRAEIEQAARRFLALVDESRWGESFDATSESFKRLNTNNAWMEASEQARVPLGRVLSRTLFSNDSVPVPPSGAEIVKFRTNFANKANAVETVSLVREDGAWRVAGIYIE